MKSKVGEIAGRAWHELGFRGKATSSQLSRCLSEDEDVVILALGWLTREDKVEATPRRHEIMYQLAASEMKVFQGYYPNGNAKKPSLLKRLLRSK